MEKGFTITYEYGDNLYVNPTNRCNFNCEFCLRHNNSGGSIYTHNLWLKREPTKEEILESIESHDLTKYRQLVFVGFGEPSYRLEDICWVIDRMKEHGTKIFTRMDTNGTGSLIHGRDITPDFCRHLGRGERYRQRQVRRFLRARRCRDPSGAGYLPVPLRRSYGLRCDQPL